MIADDNTTCFSTYSAETLLLQKAGMNGLEECHVQTHPLSQHHDPQLTVALNVH